MLSLIKEYAWLITLILMCLSFAIAFYKARRKSQWGKIETSCLYEPNIKRESGRIIQTGPASLLVEAVNHGPGEVEILALKGQYRDESVKDIMLQNPNKKLKQGDRLGRTIMPELDEDHDGFYNEDGKELIDIWFEDTYRRKHKIKDVKKHLRAMRKMTGYWGEPNT